MPDGQRLEELQTAIRAAQDALAGLDNDERQASQQQVDFLEAVSGFASVVLERSDPNLISDTAYSDIVSSANQITSQPATALSNADAFGDQLLRSVMRLPVALGRELDQNVRDAAANFQRAASQRLRALSEDFDALTARVQELRQEINSRAGEVRSQITEQTDTVTARVAELDQAITAQRQALDELMTRHSQTFSESQEERATAFRDELDAAQQRLSELEESAKKDVEERVAEIRRMEQESAALVGAIGLAGTAERYGEEAKAQKKVADWLRLFTIVLALGAVGLAVWAAIRHGDTSQAIAAKLAVALLLAGVSGYTARQSGRHRNREERARALQLELTAFSPFIEPLEPEQQEEERVRMTRRTFGNISAAPPEDEQGPTALSLLMRRKEKTPEE